VLKFLAGFVKWLTFRRLDSDDHRGHRKAEANFNPGLARSLAAYCVNGLVLYYSTPSQVFIIRSSHAGELRSPAFAREFAPPNLPEEQER
jgi:hypothetical protein